MTPVTIVVLPIGAAVLALVVLTAIGERRGGARLLVAAVGGLLFPLTLIAWYARDEFPRRTAGHL